MDYKEIEERENGILLKGVKNFHPKHIFECGQCFRWNRMDKEDEERFQGVVHGKVIRAYLTGQDVFLENVTREEFEDFFKEYFDLNRDYDKIKRVLRKDPLLKEAVAFGYGIRVLNQEPFETLISFILSSNNLIPKIKEGIRKISMNYGEEIIYEGETHYAFPTPKELAGASVEELRALGVGYRAKYIYDTVQAIRRAELIRESEGMRDLSDEEKLFLEDDLISIAALPHDQCHKALQRYTGVGAKVADCVMLFSMKKKEAFPVDVWVKKAMVHFYGAEGGNLSRIRAFGQKQFGELSGIAQQYLFYHARENKLRID
ncbi:DNA glycosylase [Proteiniclasticum sp.]|uniref:DNA-3-methyladenine glycosylase family protein n=1 Tax=Proteiniclasticum sp. TaxID=2053595 RepID=UPI00289862D2|nr:DNA glycosylase [Proteiniclasticum sp.]